MADADARDLTPERRLVTDLSAVVDRHRLSGDSPFGMALDRHLRGAMLALDALAN